MKYNPFLRTTDETFWKALGIYDTIKDKSLKKDIIGPFIFDCIITKAMEMRRLRHALEKANIESGQEGASPQPLIESNVDAEKVSVTIPESFRVVVQSSRSQSPKREPGSRSQSPKRGVEV